VRGRCQSGLVLVKDRNEAKSSDKERFKDRWVEHIETVQNQDKVAGKDIEENEKVCDTLDGKENFYVGKNKRQY